MNAYRITDWDKNYEVTKDGKPASERSKNIRKTPLSYIRLAVQGHNPSMNYREMLQKARGKGMMVFGVFCKLLELAANQPREYRGWLLDTKACPMAADRIAFALCCDTGDINFALQVLTDKDIGWVSENPFQPEQTQIASEDKKDCSVIINETKLNETETKQNITERNETKQQPKAKPASGNISNCLSDIILSAKDSSTLKNSSSSASAPPVWDWNRAKYDWSLVMQRHFPRSKHIPGDVTTFYEMIKHLFEKHGPMTDELFARAADLAKEAKSKPGIKNPLAYFVSRFKKDFGDFTKA
jgi:hypothetical protein